MFDKSRALDITKLYLNKYDELKDLLQLQSGKSEELQEDDLKLNSLLNIYIEPTNRCNLSCIFCARENAERELRMMSLEAFQNALRGIPSGSYITLTGNGEPFLNPDIYQMIECASKAGMFVSVITNAAALNEANQNKLIESGVSRVQVSFQSMDKLTYEAVMRKAKFEKALINLLEFIQKVRERNAKIYISISMVAVKESEQYAWASKQFWKKIPVDNYYEGALLSLQTDSLAYEDTCEEQEETYCVCANPWIDAKINADGSVNPCVQDFSGKYSLGNVNDCSLLEILNSEKAVRFRKAVLTGDMEFLDSIGYHCGKCNTWTSQVEGSINGFLETSFPIRLGLVTNEVAGDRPTDTAFLERVLKYLKSGGTNVLSEFRDELESF